MATSGRALFQATGNAQIHDIALDWTRKSQVIEPWQSVELRAPSDSHT